MLKRPEVAKRSARGQSTIHADIARGLFVRPVKVGAKSSAWPDFEVDAIINARIAGKTDDEIRVLVAKLEAARAKAA
ncbi:AlpA family phage regulatory protein [Ralstonia solanacearum]|nr:AlpA family phage regulatory protein [Ralstonia solanacearum]AYB60225.1 transcriptional regulator [Ralstonia solanacearum]MCG3577600.1 AlpA family phage regulatory protein [Ralstonia solanacearum]MCL9840340.1 AlpA family phage regulatory protein [Ralstonia solanacearum]MDB0533038.1 AlpA family phage regulatory protein [Ralstonia solanacearum]MDB0537875.1 AlpA family phage regulatory protein [Ralstonia solanacearum]